jgi:hypothetical protein
MDMRESQEMVASETTLRLQTMLRGRPHSGNRKLTMNNAINLRNIKKLWGNDPELCGAELGKLLL